VEVRGRGASDSPLFPSTRRENHSPSLPQDCSPFREWEDVVDGEFSFFLPASVVGWVPPAVDQEKEEFFFPRPILFLYDRRHEDLSSLLERGQGVETFLSARGRAFSHFLRTLLW